MFRAQPSSQTGQGAWTSLFPAIFMMAWGGNHFTPLLVMYRQRADFSAVQVDLFFAAYIAGLVPGFLLSGSLSDRYGRKSVMAWGLVLGAMGSAILAFGGYSAPAICVGRVVCGVSVAIAMVVGSSWIKELSSGSTHRSAGARRSSLSLTGGFAVGAFLSGALAQFGPAPMVAPYILQVVLSASCIPYLLMSPASPGNPEARVSPLRKVNLTPVNRRRYWTIVIPGALWVFAGPALGFAVAPTLVAAQAADHLIILAAALTLVTLAFGAASQQAVPALARISGGRQSAIGAGVIMLGTCLLAIAAHSPSIWLITICSAVLGVGFGIGLVSGLVEVQRMSAPEDLALLTARYYSVTYVGFLIPLFLSASAPLASTSALLLVVAAVCLASVCVAARGLSKHGGLTGL